MIRFLAFSIMGVMSQVVAFQACLNLSKYRRHGLLWYVDEASTNSIIDASQVSLVSSKSSHPHRDHEDAPREQDIPSFDSYLSTSSSNEVHGWGKQRQSEQGHSKVEEAPSEKQIASFKTCDSLSSNEDDEWGKQMLGYGSVGCAPYNSVGLHAACCDQGKDTVFPKNILRVKCETSFGSIEKNIQREKRLDKFNRKISSCYNNYVEDNDLEATAGLQTSEYDSEEVAFWGQTKVSSIDQSKNVNFPTQDCSPPFPRPILFSPKSVGTQPMAFSERKSNHDFSSLPSFGSLPRDKTSGQVSYDQIEKSSDDETNGENTEEIIASDTRLEQLLNVSSDKWHVFNTDVTKTEREVPSFGQSPTESLFIAGDVDSSVFLLDGDTDSQDNPRSLMNRGLTSNTVDFRTKDSPPPPPPFPRPIYLATNAGTSPRTSLEKTSDIDISLPSFGSLPCDQTNVQPSYGRIENSSDETNRDNTGEIVAWDTLLEEQLKVSSDKSDVTNTDVANTEKEIPSFDLKPSKSPSITGDAGWSGLSLDKDIDLQESTRSLTESSSGPAKSWINMQGESASPQTPVPVPFTDDDFKRQRQLQSSMFLSLLTSAEGEESTTETEKCENNPRGFVTSLLPTSSDSEYRQQIRAQSQTLQWDWNDALGAPSESKNVDRATKTFNQKMLAATTYEEYIQTRQESTPANMQPPQQQQKQQQQQQKSLAKANGRWKPRLLGLSQLFASQLEHLKNLTPIQNKVVFDNLFTDFGNLSK